MCHRANSKCDNLEWMVLISVEPKVMNKFVWLHNAQIHKKLYCEIPITICLYF